MHSLRHRVLQMALVPQDNVQVMFRHLNVGVYVCAKCLSSHYSHGDVISGAKVSDYLTSPCTSASR